MTVDPGFESQRYGVRTANTGAIECWNETLTPKWVRFRHLLSGNGQVHSDLAYPRIALQPGQRVLDVACGFGETTLELAERVGPLGSVLGLDCTEAFLEIAEREQRLCGVPNVEYRLSDIETAWLAPHSFDVAVSRFGIMFCASPVRALRVIARALVPGGQIGLLNWRSVADNPCWSLAEQVALRHLPPPSDQAQSCGPGPFALAHRETNERIMAAAGFTAVTHTQLDAELCVGRTLDEAVEYQMAVGPAGFVIREAGAAGERATDAIRRELRELLSRHRREDGRVWMGSSTWFIQARTGGD
jgi:ubiquinone/menaquinone biosynthesis C-methylase UbiE